MEGTLGRHTRWRIPLELVSMGWANSMKDTSNDIEVSIEWMICSSKHAMECTLGDSWISLEWVLNGIHANESAPNSRYWYSGVFLVDFMQTISCIRNGNTYFLWYMEVVSILCVSILICGEYFIRPSRLVVSYDYLPVWYIGGSAIRKRFLAFYIPATKDYTLWDIISSNLYFRRVQTHHRTNCESYLHLMPFKMNGGTV